MSERSENQEGPVDAAERELLRQLGAALDAADPVPPATTDAAHQLLRWRADDADLALLGLADLAPVRSGSTLQVHRFTVDDVEIELTIDGPVVSGVIEPWPTDQAGAGGGDHDSTATIEQVDDGGSEAPAPGAGRSLPVEVDDDGEFDLELPGAGPIRLVVEGGGRRIRTEWVLPG